MFCGGFLLAGVMLGQLLGDGVWRNDSDRMLREMEVGEATPESEPMG
ncbi:hypothetical protein QFZ77_001152 [Paenibacillus sp. V4I3]|nr:MULTISPECIES: hypothetical protein [unclassified Paenibacillus]MDQ0872493.1 hypothetical protein [Paenibacillus sp. V4I3]MDQ0891622.1 hypothetical protein [Paenibacillus sp. V4I9]